MASRSLADTYISLGELMRLARGSFKRERRCSADEIQGLRRGLLALAEIKRSLPEP